MECAETLRQEGFKGRIVLADRETVLPYDRPKLSKVSILFTEMSVSIPSSFTEMSVSILFTEMSVSILSSFTEMSVSILFTEMSVSILSSFTEMSVSILSSFTEMSVSILSSFTEMSVSILGNLLSYHHILFYCEYTVLVCPHTTGYGCDSRIHCPQTK